MRLFAGAGPHEGGAPRAAAPPARATSGSTRRWPRRATSRGRSTSPRASRGSSLSRAPSLWDRATGAVGDAFSGAVAVGELLGRPLVLTWTTVAARRRRSAPRSRTCARWRRASRRTCGRVTTAPTDAAPGAGGGGSGHLLFAVGGINSAHRPADRRVVRARHAGPSATTPTRSAGSRTGATAVRTRAATPGPTSSPRRTTCATSSGRSRPPTPAARSTSSPTRRVGSSSTRSSSSSYDPTDPTLPPLGTVVTLASPHQGAPLAEVAADVRTLGVPVGRCSTASSGSPAARSRRRAVGRPASSIPARRSCAGCAPGRSPTRST